MEKITTIGLDLAKSIFQVHGIAEDGHVVVRRALRRSQMLEFFRSLEPCLVGLEACASAHHWANTISQFGICALHARLQRRGRSRDRPRHAAGDGNADAVHGGLRHVARRDFRVLRVPDRRFHARNRPPQAEGGPSCYRWQRLRTSSGRPSGS